MDKPTIQFWIDRCSELERDRNEWRTAAKRLSSPFHDQDCDYGVACSYCSAMNKVASD